MSAECATTPVTWSNQVFDLDERTLLTHVDTVNEVIGSLLGNLHRRYHVGTEVVLSVEGNFDCLILVAASISGHLEEHIHLLGVQEFLSKVTALVVSDSVERHSWIVVFDLSNHFAVNLEGEATILNSEVVALATDGLSTLHVVAEEILECSDSLVECQHTVFSDEW